MTSGGGEVEHLIGGVRIGRGGWLVRSVAGAVMEGCGFAGQRGERVELRRFELDVGCGGVGVELVGGLGADDGGGDGRAGQQPGQRDLIRRQPPGAAETLDSRAKAISASLNPAAPKRWSQPGERDLVRLPVPRRG